MICLGADIKTSKTPQNSPIHLDLRDFYGWSNGLYWIRGESRSNQKEFFSLYFMFNPKFICQ